MNRSLYDTSPSDSDYINSQVNCDAQIAPPCCLEDNFCVSSPPTVNGGILTMAFVDMQPLDSVYRADTAFCRGTLFPNIDKPLYTGGRK